MLVSLTPGPNDACFSDRLDVGADERALDHRARPERARRVVEDLGVQLLPTEPRALVFLDDRVDERVGEVRDIVEGRPAGDERLGVLALRILDQALDDRRRPRRRRDDGLRLIAETEAERGLIPCVGIAPRRELVAPELLVLLAEQPVRLFGGEQERLRPVRPMQFALVGDIIGPLIWWADRKNA